METFNNLNILKIFGTFEYFINNQNIEIDCIYIFQFTLRTSGKSEDIWFESDEALINSS